MTGFRVGWLASKGHEFISTATKLMEPLISCGVPFSQAGAEAALRSPEARAYAEMMRNTQRSSVSFMHTHKKAQPPRQSDR